MFADVAGKRGPRALTISGDAPTVTARRGVSRARAFELLGEFLTKLFGRLSQLIGLLAEFFQLSKAFVVDHGPQSK